MKTEFPGSATCLGIIQSSWTHPPLSDTDVLQRLNHPVWSDGGHRTVFDIIRPGETVCLIVSDHTRQTAANRILPLLLRGMEEEGYRPGDLFFLVASGIHRHPTQGEITKILGPETAGRFRGRVFLHDPDDKQNLLCVGTTRRGHPVTVNRRAVEADRLLLLGAAGYHYHAGFGGGRKSLVPGIAGRNTIAYNHSLTLDPDADRIHPRVQPGILDGNPVAEEMLEGASFCKPDLIINSVLTPEGTLADVFAGDLDLAHRAACRRVTEVDGVRIAEEADFVIASAENASNWIQSHKALFHASRSVKSTGRIILEAPCPEGLGDERFRYWLTKSSISEMYRELRSAPEVLGQTALSTRERGARTILVTQMPKRDIQDLGIITAPDLEAAFRIVLDDLARSGNRRPTYYQMPHARHTVPFMNTR